VLRTLVAEAGLTERSTERPFRNRRGYPLYGPRLSEPPRVAHCWVHGKCEDVAQTDRRIPRERAECREIC
jgi:hypothetical protein